MINASAQPVLQDYAKFVASRPSPSPEVPAVNEVGTCPKCQDPLLNIEGNSVCACERGHLFSLPTLAPLMEV